MSKRLIYFLLVLLLVADLGFSFMQYYTTPLDGDMAGGIVPAEAVKDVLANPLGQEAILHGKVYSNPNRFICHWTFKSYFSTAPFVLQRFVSPIDSIYLANAIFKTFIHALLLFLLAVAVTGSKKMLKLNFMAAMVLLTALFQANGYRIYMGIIDPSITYTFFYAMPTALILLYFSPMIREFYHGKAVSSIWIKILWIPLALVVCLSGPLNPGIALICSLLLVFNHLRLSFRKSDATGFWRKLAFSIRTLPAKYWFYLLPLSVFALYSLFLGRYNYINVVNEIPLGQMFMRLPAGVYYLLSQKPGMPLLLLAIFFNMLLIRMKYRSNAGKRILRIFGWIGIFSLLYILLLPFGGYRDYRSNILRYDTIMPITLMLMFAFAASTLFIAKNISRRQQPVFSVLVALFLLIYANADRGQFERNACERTALQKIANSKAAVVHLESDCKVLSWGEISNPQDSELNAKLLRFWNITEKEKLYVNR